jgi:hypothetical protein
MNPKAKTQVHGFNHGPYSMGTATLSDITVTATNDAGETIIVGRFPFTRNIDAEAQARAYIVLPDLIKATRDLLQLATRNDIPEGERPAIAEHAIETLKKAGAA